MTELRDDQEVNFTELLEHMMRTQGIAGILDRMIIVADNMSTELEGDELASWRYCVYLLAGYADSVRWFDE